MSEQAPEARARMIAARVRQNAFYAGIAAAVLLWVGFLTSWIVVDETLALLARNIFLWTARIAGVALAVITLWSWIGQVKALLLNAVVSVPAGAALILTAVLFVAGGGFGLNVLLYGIFGAIFISSGVRNWRDYWALSGAGGASAFGAAAEYDPHFEQAYEQARSEPAGPSLASQLRERTQRAGSGEAEPQPERVLTEPRPVEEAAPTSGRSPGRPVPQGLVEPVSQSPHSAPEGEQTGASDPYEAPASTGDDDEEPPDGFLAGFADEGPPRRP